MMIDEVLKLIIPVYYFSKRSRKAENIHIERKVYVYSKQEGKKRRQAQPLLFTAKTIIKDQRGLKNRPTRNQASKTKFHLKYRAATEGYQAATEGYRAAKYKK